MRRRELMALGTAALFAGLAPRGVFGSNAYPARTITLIVPFAVGGLFDSVARTWADAAKTELGSIVIQNVAGASGSLGATAVARAEPDGYTLLAGGAGPLIFNPIASSPSPYDPVNDFEPIAILVRGALAIAVHPSIPVHDLKGLIGYVKANPGKVSYGSAGVGSANHFAGEMLVSLAGLRDLVHVPYKGAGPATTDLLGGQIPMAILSVNAQVIELHRAGKLKILAVTGGSRLRNARDIPTTTDEGFPGLVAESFIGLFAPKRTPDAIIRKLATATQSVLGNPNSQATFLAAGLEPELASSPEAARRFVADEIARWTPIVQGIDFKTR